MCIFCAAIPATAALGAALHGKQAEARRRAETTSEQAPEAAPQAIALRQLPIAGITGLVLAGLVVGSVVTHVTTTASG
jgi:hypothetical protein